MNRVTVCVRWLVLLQVLAVLLGGLAGPVFAQEIGAAEPAEATPVSEEAVVPDEALDEDGGDEIYFFLGRFHPVVLHFPIGLLVVVCVLELIALYRTSHGFESAIWVVLITGFAMAVVSAVFGVFLSWSDSYAEETLFWHKWQGISVAVLSGVAVLLKLRHASTDEPLYGYAYRTVLVACLVTIAFAAHNGGTLVRGSNYLVEYMPDRMASLLGIDTTATELASVGDGVLGDHAMAVFSTNCIKCHGPDKQSAKLRLDTYEAVLAGTEDGELVVRSGDAMNSEMIRRITSPEDHDDVMPPAGKGSLAPEEMWTLINWINQGLPRGDGTGAPLVAVVEPEEEEASASPPDAPAPTPEAPAEGATGPVNFALQVWPIFEGRCIECHGADKQKGQLRLDAPEWLAPTDEGDDIIVAGNPGASELYEHITLPADHDDRMPQKDDPLSTEQIDVIRRWIEQGAALGDWQGAAGVVEERTPTREELLEAELGALNEEQRALVARLGQRVMPLARNSSLLSVDLGATSVGSPEFQLDDLAPIAEYVTSLSLATVEVAADDFAQLGRFANLFSLHLEKTNVSDGDLAHLSRLNRLEYLNLFGTEVSDEGLTHLRGLTSLKNLYLWKTQVTQAGADALAGAVPGVNINLGIPASALEPIEEGEEEEEEEEEADGDA